MSNYNVLVKLSDLIKVKRGENSEDFSILNGISKNIVCKYEKDDMKKYLGENILVRKTVAQKLLNVSEKLNHINSDYILKIIYGYRHPDVQSKYFEIRKSEIKEKNPEDTEEELNQKTHMFVADPRVAGHPTGGAVDITITTSNNDLDMGTKIADYSNEEKVQTFSKQITDLQRKNRELLHDLMVSEGFAPFYGEWWHFSYGDTEWAFLYKKDSSLYSTKEFTLPN